jgi:hypothetical protein
MSCEVENELGICSFRVSFACAQHVFCCPSNSVFNGGKFQGSLERFEQN